MKKPTPFDNLVAQEFKVLSDQMDKQEEIHKQALELGKKVGPDNLSPDLKAIYNAASVGYAVHGTWKMRGSVVQKVYDAAIESAKAKTKKANARSNKR